MGHHLEWLKTTEIQYCPEIGFGNKLLAPVVGFVKRVLRKLFVFIGVPLVADINEYHRRLTLELSDMQTAADTAATVLRAELTSAFHMELDDVRAELGDVRAELDGVRAELDDVRAELDDVRASISVLYAGSNASDERYLALHRLATLNARMLEPLTLEHHKRKFGVIDDTADSLTQTTSSLARRKEIIAYADWTRQMCIEPLMLMHRKIWEWVYITQALYERGMLKPGMKGLGFAVGSEPLPALFAKHGVTVTATDLEDGHPAADAWKTGNQHASNLSAIEHPEICNPESFYRLVQFMPLDMNHIPDTLNGFDFCWSSCAFEHLGSARQGREFILNTLNVLNPGGVSVHTTEFNLSVDENIDEIPYHTIYGKGFLEDLRDEISAMGHYFAPFDYRLGEHPDEDYIYKFTEPEAHFKLLLGNYITTSVGIIIVKSK